MREVTLPGDTQVDEAWDSGRVADPRTRVMNPG